MTNNQKVVQVIFSAVDDLNQQLPRDQHLEKSTDSVLLGSQKLDSLGFVNLIVATEQKIEEEFGTPVSLFDEKAMSQQNSPFKNIGTLADYIDSLLENRTK